MSRPLSSHSATHHPPTAALPRSLRIVIATVLVLSSVGAVHAAAPTEVLPLSGLLIDRPSEGTRRFTLSASWSLDEVAGTFDGRDVIDAYDGDALVAGTWVQVGWFTDGACADVVQRSAIAPAWEDLALSLWGTKVAARGGTFTFEDALGTRPALILCVTRGTRKQLVLYHFFLDDGATTDRQRMLKALRRGSVPELAHRAWRADRVAASAPRLRSDVRDRSGHRHPEVLHLTATGLDVRLPDDGSMWLRDDGFSGVDRFNRMAPALPEITVELATASVPCEDALRALGPSRRATTLTHVPPHWLIGPVLAVETGELEDTLCRPFAWGSLLVGVISAPRQRDLGALDPLLAALSEAARGGPPEGRVAPRDLRLGQRRVRPLPGARAEATPTP